MAVLGHGHGPHLAPRESALLPPGHRAGARLGVGARGGGRLLGLERAAAELPDVLAVARAHLLRHGPVEAAVDADEARGAAAPPAQHLLPRERLRRGLHLRRRRAAGRARVSGLRGGRVGLRLGRPQPRRLRAGGCGLPVGGGHGAPGLSPDLGQGGELWWRMARRREDGGVESSRVAWMEALLLFV